MSEETGVGLVVFTRDLRVRDHPALNAAIAGSQRVATAFILDSELLATSHGSPNRLRFLIDCLHDLRSSLRERNGELLIRHGQWVDQVVALVDECGASAVHLSRDVSAYSKKRNAELRSKLAATTCEVHEHEGITVLRPGATRPGSGGFWKVFTPYYNKWIEAPWRQVLPPPKSMATLETLNPGEIPKLEEITQKQPSEELPPGGETAGLDRLKVWAKNSLESYEDNRNDVALDDTSRISAYIHFGCLSPLEVATRLLGRQGAGPFIRQLCWRDFYHQALDARPEISQSDYRTRGDIWRVDEADAEAWREGNTGYPLVDAAMRQLRAEGFMHNRARMVVASFLTKDLYLDWRIGAAHFMEFLVDGDVANNQLNWQWNAGTGADSNPNRIFNPTVQSTRFDPDGSYIRRYLPVLAGVPAPLIHDPDVETRLRVGYPLPIVDHKQAIAAYRAQLASYRSQGTE
ncbi:MAG: deoxyribodipyrimidine photo-lyase [Microthrixaceae bacterium]